jgi:hypothetical protein
MFRTGYILCKRDDLVWFLFLPFVAVLVALACQQWLPAVALASITLCITAPHHFATWLRTYGTKEDWQRWKTRLIVGPIALIVLVVAGITWVPWTLFLVTIMWDHQHSIMQQYGIARIYDFKAKSGGQRTPRFDLTLCWILFINLFLTAPLFTRFWVRELYRWHLPVSVETVHVVHQCSWWFTGLFLTTYLVHVAMTLRAGDSLNPIKLAFIGASFFLWYFTAWQTDSILVFGIAHRLMHGLQYIVIVYWYVRRKQQSRDEGDRDRVAGLFSRGKVLRFVTACLVYAFVFQLLAGQPLERFGFGVVNFAGQVNYDEAFAVYAATVINLAALTHYYFDSFIWKVRDERIQGGL